MKHTANLKVRSYECDSYGHVNNAVYLNFLEYARMEFLNDSGFDYNGVTKAGYSLYVTRIDISYKQSCWLNDEIYIISWPVKLGAVSGMFHQVVQKKDGTVAAAADVSWAIVDKNGKPSRLPPEFMVAALQPDPNDMQESK